MATTGACVGEAHVAASCGVYWRGMGVQQVAVAVVVVVVFTVAASKGVGVKGQHRLVLTCAVGGAQGRCR